MVDVPGEVRAYNESRIDEASRLRHVAGQLEFVRTQEIIRRHLPPGPLQVVDVGGGAGVHAEWLAEDGHAVHLIDPMVRHVEAAVRLGGALGRVTAEVGDRVSCLWRAVAPMWCCLRARSTT